AYAGLDATVGTWLGRAVAGWYRSTKEAANAYAVLAGAGRGALDASRSSLAAADSARASAAAGMTAALRTAGEATAALRSG
ncbi:MAG: hypothetical protein M3Z02_10655, partial [Actinomycetota bacterium]|nr:hypothetical protein [Actinomycetota bacterium]